MIESKVGDKVSTSGRMVQQYKINLGVTKIIFEHEIQFKCIRKAGPDLYLIVERVSMKPNQHEVEIRSFGSQSFLHPRAKYIDSLVVGDQLVHFYAQHPLAYEEDVRADSKRVGGVNG